MEYEIVKEVISPCAGDNHPLSCTIEEKEVADPMAYVKSLYTQEKDMVYNASNKNGSLVIEAVFISAAKHRYTFTEI